VHKERREIRPGKKDKSTTSPIKIGRKEGTKKEDKSWGLSKAMYTSYDRSSPKGRRRPDRKRGNYFPKEKEKG